MPSEEQSVPKIKVGIGFVTGRKSFQKVLKTHIFHWEESEVPGKENISLCLLVAYDLKYSNTKSTDYTNVSKEVLTLIDETYFIDGAAIRQEISHLETEGVIDEAQAKLLFGNGYAARRNALLYTAMKNNMDYLIFLDDDEYPMAVTKIRSATAWSGQHILSSHLYYIQDADITNGHHCGYVSPLPHVKFNDAMNENDFHRFVEAISNDAINWDSVCSIMGNGGVSYADIAMLATDVAEVVDEVNHTKFISGSNLCINLSNPRRVNPFYNPPGARGEDTFLSACLSERTVLRIPYYTFHDGFSAYSHLMDGVLPVKLDNVQADSEKITTRFYRACIGWVRYKPLLLFITQREQYELRITEMRENLSVTLPKICAYFGSDSFMNISKEFERYHKNVTKHYNQFLEGQDAWGKITEYLSKSR
ncbi:MAG: hypothetical protein HGA54_08170 [Actinobacteria bacterium]|nr:hypothetical protein [Actinomycetota bacterium]